MGLISLKEKGQFLTPYAWQHSTNVPSSCTMVSYQIQLWDQKRSDVKPAYRGVCLRRGVKLLRVMIKAWPFNGAAVRQIHCCSLGSFPLTQQPAGQDAEEGSAASPMKTNGSRIICTYSINYEIIYLLSHRSLQIILKIISFKHWFTCCAQVNSLGKSQSL